MSDFSLQREWRFYIDDMIGFADKVLAGKLRDTHFA